MSCKGGWVSAVGSATCQGWMGQCCWQCYLLSGAMSRSRNVTKTWTRSDSVDVVHPYHLYAAAMDRSGYISLCYRSHLAEATPPWGSFDTDSPQLKALEIVSNTGYS